MFCENCGKEIKDTGKFCNQCGWRIEINKPAQDGGLSVQNMEPYYYGSNNNQAVQEPAEVISSSINIGDNNRKKGKSGIIVGILIAIAALAGIVALVLLNFNLLANFVLRTFASPEKYYQYVEKKALVENTLTMATLYENYFLSEIDSEKQGVEGTISVSLGDDIIELIEENADPGAGISDFSWLQKMAIGISGNQTEDLYQRKLSLSLNDENIFVGEAFIDIENEELYLGLPELGEDYAVVKIPEEFQEYEIGDLKDKVDSMESFSEKAPQKEEVMKLLYRYFCTAVETIDNVEKDSDELKIEGISGKYTTLKVTFDTELMSRITESILKEMQSDEELKKIILDIASEQEGIDEEDLYEDFVEEIDNVLEELNDLVEESEDDESKLVMMIYVDGKGNIRGREFKAESEDEEILSFGYKIPIEGEDFGLKIYAETEEADVELSGRGKRERDVISGEFTCSVEDIEIVDISLMDYDVAKAKNGYINGNVSLKFSELVVRYTDIPNLADYAMDLDIQMEEEIRDVKAVVHEGKKEVLSFASSFERRKSETVELPSEDDTIEIEKEEDVLKFILKLDLDEFVDSLRKAGLPSELVDELEFYTKFM